MICKILDLWQLELLSFKHLFDDAWRHLDHLGQLNGVDYEAAPIDRHALDVAPVVHPIKSPFVLLTQREN